MTDLSATMNDLALAVVNNGPDYQHRLVFARLPDGKRAVCWVLLANEMAGRLWKEHDHLFNDTEILRAATELEEYYAEHIKEIDRYQA